jgi:hypothetical protein
MLLLLYLTTEQTDVSEKVVIIIIIMTITTVIIVVSGTRGVMSDKEGSVVLVFLRCHIISKKSGNRYNL